MRYLVQSYYSNGDLAGFQYFDTRHAAQQSADRIRALSNGQRRVEVIDVHASRPQPGDLNAVPYGC